MGLSRIVERKRLGHGPFERLLALRVLAIVLFEAVGSARSWARKAQG